jgi:aminoglycoside phosphotransferase (APT) family kinase protein
MEDPAYPDVEGIDVPKVSDWFAANIPGAVLPLHFTLVAGGRSNLTFRVTDSGGRAYALRRPPVSHVLPTAHDMGREHRIIAALGPTGLPVPPALGYCADESVNGRPFYVMGFVDGHVLRKAEVVAQLGLPARRRAGESLIDTLAGIHAVDVDAVGLGDLARRDGYIARQLKRWYSQYQQSKGMGGPDVADIDEVHDLLADRIPDQVGTAIVHGDYRLDNCIVGDDGEVRAVLDWELCTLGDPLADLGILMVYWAEPGDPSTALMESATQAPGFPSRVELRERYADRSGRDLSELDFYVAFGYWKLACVLEGVFARYAGGAGGGDPTDYRGFADQVVRLARSAADMAATLA